MVLDESPAGAEGAAQASCCWQDGGKSWLRTAGFEQAQFRGNEREGGKREGML